MQAPFPAVPDGPPRTASDRFRDLWGRLAEGVPRGLRWALRRSTVAWLLFLSPPVVTFLLLVSSGPQDATLERSPLHAVAVLTGTVLAAMLGASLALLYLAVTEIFRGEPPAVESHWGGFGGGLGGWRISSSLAYLLGALFLGGLFGALLLTGLRSDVAKSWLGIQTPEAASDTEATSPPASNAQDEDGDQGGATEGSESGGAGGE